jgi:transcriptional regulator with XRE-family HTH domain
MLSNNLRVERVKKGISVTKLACQVGLSPSTLSEFERGIRRPWPRARADLSRVLGISVRELFPDLELISENHSTEDRIH